MRNDLRKVEPILQLGLTVAQAARHAGLSENVMRRLIQAGDIPHRRVGRRVVVSAEGLRRWINGEGGEDAR